jgi:acetyltransferase-like isoleucine patch superfamily enzyme
VNSLFALAREDGWAQVLPRALISLFRRLRDGLTARKLGAPGFRVGGSPRILGLSHMRVGRNFSAGDRLWLDAVTRYGGEKYTPELIVGSDVNLSAGVHIACLHRVQIGDGLLAGSHVLISDHTHGVYSGSMSQSQSDPESIPANRPLHSADEVIIGRNVWLGDGVCVLAGARIGDGAIIGANSVVLGEIPAATFAVGAPARVVRRWNAGERRWGRASEG